MKKKILTLNKLTVANLNEADLKQIMGGDSKNCPGSNCETCDASFDFCPPRTRENSCWPGMEG